MSHSGEQENTTLQFNWGIKRGRGGAKKDIQFYESFTFDGIDYSLYDCVYLCKKDEHEPYIGKIVKIWEQRDGKKKVKILWFFHPDELQTYLGEHAPLEKEIFLAYGGETGAYNINPLEAIAGKCFVLCTSKDARNPQPPEEALGMSDYIFYRIFDVGNFTISEKIPDQIVGVEAKHLLNREEDWKEILTSKLKANDNFTKEKTDANVLPHDTSNSGSLRLVGHKVEDKLAIVPSSSPKAGVIEGKHLNEENISPRKSASIIDATSNGELVTRTTGVGHKVEDKLDIVPSSSPKAGVIEGKHLNEENMSPRKSASIIDSTSNGELVTRTTVGHAEDAKSLKNKANSSLSDEKPSKKKRPNDDSVRPSDDIQNKNTSMQKLKIESGDDGFGKCRDQLHNDDLTKIKHIEKKSSPAVLVKNDANANNQIMEVMKRPDAERRKWFKQVPWEGRLKTADEHGTLVLLDNFDPSYTEREIEDIVYQIFKQSCSAKVIQQGTFQNLNYGQAYIIFKTTNAAELVVHKINSGCLMLPNGRPLVASRGLLKIPSKSSILTGHLTIDKIKHQLQHEEWKRAVATSHCSQPNTIEYEMAMDWMLVQEKASSSFNRLYKVHRDERYNVKKDLKTK